MTSTIPIVLVVARYDLSEDAKADLTTAARFFADKEVDSYDAALLTSDAWAQVEIDVWEARLPGHAPNVLRRVRAGLVGKPLAALHDPGIDLGIVGGGLSWLDLERVGLTMSQDSAVLVVAAQTGEPDALAACFSHASRLGRQEVAAEPAGAYPALRPALDRLLAPAEARESPHNGITP
jgi:hypothetical protein